MEAHRSHRIDREVLRWLSPSNNEPCYYQDRYKELIMSRCDGTCEWLLHEDSFQLWELPETAESILWIQGDPGCGKSVLTATVVEHLKRNKKSSLLYFFLDARSNNAEATEPVAVIRSLVYQIFSSPLLPPNDVVRNAVQRSCQERALRFDVLWKLLVAMLCLTNSTYIVIDALDECTDPELLITRFLQLALNIDCGIRIAFSSRAISEPAICDLLKGATSIQVTPKMTARDISHFISQGTQQFSNEGNFSSAVIEHISSSLTLNASGMYGPSSCYLTSCLTRVGSFGSNCSLTN